MPLKLGFTIRSCKYCHIPLRMGNNRIVFCIKCHEVYDGAPQPTQTLCCVECDQPLAVVLSSNVVGNGSYCTSCKFHPTMQDTYLLQRKQH